MPGRFSVSLVIALCLGVSAADAQGPEPPGTEAQGSDSPGIEAPGPESGGPGTEADPDEADRDEADRDEAAPDEAAPDAAALYDAAREAYSSGDDARARDLFTRSLELRPDVRTAGNLGVVLANLGELLAAEALLERVLAGELGEVPDAQRGAIEGILREVRAAQPRVQVSIRGRNSARLVVDGEERGEVGIADARELRIDPGTSRISAVDGEGNLSAEQVTLERGESRAVELVFVDVDALAGAPEDESPEDESPAEPSPPRRSYAWVAGVVAGVVVAAVVPAVVITQVDSGGDPITDPIFPTATVLRAGF